MKHGSLFSGIGGFDLAAQWMGWENVFHCEKNDFGRKVLNHYWPESISYEDVTTTDFTIHAGSIDVLTAGFPCQPFSTAGKREGSGDDRHLFPATIEIVKQIRPSVCVFENVLGLTSILESACETDLETKAIELFSEGVSDKEVETIYRRIRQRTLGTIISHIEEAGYKLPETLTGEPIILCIPACAVNAPHRRDRIWFVAYANDFLHKGGLDTGGNSEKANGSKGGHKQKGRCKDGERVWVEPCTSRKTSTNSGSSGRLQDYQEQRTEQSTQGVSDWRSFPTQPPICGGDDGLPTELDGITVSLHRRESIKAYGNAIVPQVAYQIFKAIEETIFNQ